MTALPKQTAILPRHTGFGRTPAFADNTYLLVLS
jgi:hypothetical protein